MTLAEIREATTAAILGIIIMVAATAVIMEIQEILAMKTAEELKAATMAIPEANKPAAATEIATTQETTLRVIRAVGTMAVEAIASKTITEATKIIVAPELPTATIRQIALLLILKINPRAEAGGV